MRRNTIGPYFQCYPADYIAGIADLSAGEIGYFTFIIMRNYAEADAVYMTETQLGRSLKSNAAGARRNIESLKAKGKIIELAGGGLINPRALGEMIAQIARRPGSISARVKERIAALYEQYEAGAPDQVSDKFRETFENVLQNISKTTAKNPIKTTADYKRLEARHQNPNKKINQKRFLHLMPQPGTQTHALAEAVIARHSLETWGAWFSDKQAEIEGRTIYARSRYIAAQYTGRFMATLAAAGFSVAAEIRPAPAPAAKSNQDSEAKPERESL